MLPTAMVTTTITTETTEPMATYSRGNVNLSELCGTGVYSNESIITICNKCLFNVGTLLKNIGIYKKRAITFKYTRTRVSSKSNTKGICVQETSNLRSSGNATSVVIAGSWVVSGVVLGEVTSSGSFKSLKRCNRVVIGVNIWSILKVTRKFMKHLGKH